MNDKKLEEINSFIENECSIVECAKRYKNDVKYLLEYIHDQELAIHRLERKCGPIITSFEYSRERREKLLGDIMDLIKQYQDEPQACGI